MRFMYDELLEKIKKATLILIGGFFFVIVLGVFLLYQQSQVPALAPVPAQVPVVSDPSVQQEAASEQKAERAGFPLIRDGQAVSESGA